MGWPSEFGKHAQGRRVTALFQDLFWSDGEQGARLDYDIFF
jgi:hypothetical protein